MNRYQEASLDAGDNWKKISTKESVKTKNTEDIQDGNTHLSGNRVLGKNYLYEIIDPCSL